MKHCKNNTLRIIGGKWRGRKLHFCDKTSIRPTTDFIRETLFNWLEPHIHDAVCLDLFAGSGAIGFEALSRGAKRVYFVDQSHTVINRLKQNAQILEAKNTKFYCQNFTPAMELNSLDKFDIVFIDPPFKQNLINPVCKWLTENDCLADYALIYLETEKNPPRITAPKNWNLFRHKISGQVSYALYKSIIVK